MRSHNTHKARTRVAARNLATGTIVAALAVAFIGFSLAYTILVTLEGAVK